MNASKSNPARKRDGDSGTTGNVHQKEDQPRSFRSLHSVVRWVGHRIAHLFGMNTGQIESWKEGGRYMIGFRCSCGQLSGIHESVLTANKDLSRGEPAAGET